VGYTTDFNGEFSLDKQLSDEHYEYLLKFSETRRMKRDAVKVAHLKDPVREAVGLDVGIEGEFFVGAKGWAGQDKDSSIIDYNSPPTTQPGLWCQWIPSKSKDAIEWDGNEKFYDYVEWIQYMINNFFSPWGYVLNGIVYWKGEDENDVGLINIKNNVLEVKSKLKLMYPKGYKDY